MQIQSLTKAQALERLRGEQVSLLQQGSSHRATAVSDAYHTLEAGKGETLWDVYRNAEDSLQNARRVRDVVAPEYHFDDRQEGRAMGTLAGLVGAGAVATAATHYARTGDLGTAALLGLIPLGAGLISVMGLWIGMDSGLDISRPVGATISATTVAAVATQHWVAPVATAGALIAGTVALTALAGRRMKQQQTIQAAIDQNRELFAKPPDASAQLGEKITKRDILGTLNRLQQEAVREADFAAAVALRSAIGTLGRCEGANFTEMMARADDDQRKTLIQYASPVLEDARQRDEVEALIRGSEEPASLLVGEETVIVGDHELARS